MISIVVPTLNEKKSLPALFQRIKSSMKSPYEIIIVDSESEDGTLELAKKLSKRYPVRAFNAGNLDLGNSAVFGMKKAGGNIIAVMDADLQHPPEMLPKMLKKLEQEKADIVIASRFAKGAGTKLGFSRTVESAPDTSEDKMLYPPFNPISRQSDFRVKDG